SKNTFAALSTVNPRVKIGATEIEFLEHVNNGALTRDEREMLKLNEIHILIFKVTNNSDYVNIGDEISMLVKDETTQTGILTYYPGEFQLIAMNNKKYGFRLSHALRDFKESTSKRLGMHAIFSRNGWGKLSPLESLILCVIHKPTNSHNISVKFIGVPTEFEAETGKAKKRNVFEFKLAN
ncbi:hypothetical protein KAW08_02000, partial [bacterium]|nr:hypothetical protein [bacterium]